MVFLLQNNFKLFGDPIFWHWEYLMKVIPETRRANWTWYLRVYDYHCVNHPRSTQCLGTNIYIYTSENKLNQTVLELDFRAVKYICKTRIHVQSLIDVQSSNPCSIPTSQTSVPQIYVLFSNSQNGAQWHHWRMLQITPHPLVQVFETMMEKGQKMKDSW